MFSFLWFYSGIPSSGFLSVFSPIKNKTDALLVIAISQCIISAAVAAAVIGLKISKRLGFFMLTIAQAFSLITNREISDLEKEKRLRQKLLMAILHFGKLLFVIVILAQVWLWPTWLVIHFCLDGDLFANGALDQFLSWPTLLLGTLGFLLAFGLIKKNLKPETEDYNLADKFLHYVYLSSVPLARMSFVFEKVLFKSKLRKTLPPTIIITGLARSGTTALTQNLHKTGGFASLSYRNMPFILMPNFWKRINGAKSIEKERNHADGMLHSLDSVEALEEFFWVTELKRNYVSKHSLNLHQINAHTLGKYGEYRKLIVENDDCYLAKNNNFLLRLASFLQQDESAEIIITFRHPAQHIASLKRQHQLFANMQKNDEFVRFYMDALVHHEFGMGFKTMNFGEELPSDFEDINWESVWKNYYDYALQFAGHPRVHFVAHQQFCEEPKVIVNKIRSIMGLKSSALELKAYQVKETSLTIHEDLISLYQQLIKISFSKQSSY